MAPPEQLLPPGPATSTSNPNNGSVGRGGAAAGVTGSSVRRIDAGAGAGGRGPAYTPQIEKAREAAMRRARQDADGGGSTAVQKTDAREHAAAPPASNDPSSSAPITYGSAAYKELQALEQVRAPPACHRVARACQHLLHRARAPRQVRCARRQGHMRPV